MGWNEIIFGGLMIAGIAVFFFFARYKAGKKQYQRDDKIRWRKF